MLAETALQSEIWYNNFGKDKMDRFDIIILH